MNPSKKVLIWLAVMSAVVLSLVSSRAGAQVSHSASTASSHAGVGTKIINYLRAWGYFPDQAQVDVQSCGSSQNPAYYECTLAASYNGKSGTETDSISKNERYLARSPMFYLGPDTKNELLSDIRARYKLGAEWNLTAGTIGPSMFPGFSQVQVTAENAGKKQQAPFYLTADKKFFVVGPVYVLRSPAEIERMINMRDQPHSGPAAAPVTIVEYADLECPVCAKLQPFLENQLLPRYGDKIRLIYKDFPLPSHDWSREAAIANQCAFRIDPPAFARYRTAIFADQAQINVTNVRDMLLQLGEQAGIDRLKLASCLDAKATAPAVQSDYEEATRLQVNFTPTCIINGRPLVGEAPPENYFHLIDSDLQHARPASSAQRRQRARRTAEASNREAAPVK